MSGKKTSVKVEILGESYVLRTEAAPEHTKAVAEYLDKAIRQILSGGSVIDEVRLSITRSVTRSALSVAPPLLYCFTLLKAAIKYASGAAASLPESEAKIFCARRFNSTTSSSVRPPTSCR